VVITAPSSVLFSQDFKPWLIKPIWVFQDGQISLRVAKPSGRDCVLRERMLSSILRSQSAINVAWLISPKIDMDTHTNEILTLEP
jgi:hypothetical protein